YLKELVPAGWRRQLVIVKDFLVVPEDVPAVHADRHGVLIALIRDNVHKVPGEDGEPPLTLEQLRDRFHVAGDDPCARKFLPAVTEPACIPARNGDIISAVTMTSTVQNHTAVRLILCIMDRPPRLQPGGTRSFYTACPTS